MKFKRYSRDSGLVQSTVYTILQDKKGLMWFGTQEGLSRFDGYSMKTYKHEKDAMNSLGGQSVFTSMLDSRGRLWFGSENGNFSKFIAEEDKFINFNLAQKFSALNAVSGVSSFCEDEYGNIFIGTYGAGLIMFREGLTVDNRKDMRLVRLLPDIKEVSCMKMDKDGKLFFGTFNHGLFCIDFRQSRLRGLKSSASFIDGLNGSSLRCLLCDSVGRIFAGTSNGLNKILSGKVIESYSYDGKPEGLSYNVITSLAEDKDRRLWVGTRNGGLNLFEERKKRFVHYTSKVEDPQTISDNSLLSLFIDRTNVLWAGTVSSGFSKADLDSKPFNNPKDINEDFGNIDKVNCILRDSRSEFFIGTHNKGMIVSGKSFENMRIFHKKSADPKRHFPANTIFSIRETPDSRIWIGAHSGGLLEFDRSSQSFISYGNEFDSRLKNVFSLCVDSKNENTLLAGTESGGFFEFNTKSCRFIKSFATKAVRDQAGDTIIKSIYADSSGTIWLSAGNKGLIRISDNRRSVVRMSEADERFSDNIRYIGEDSKGCLLICTAVNGLLIFDPSTGGVKAFTESEGLAGNSVVSAIEDDTGLLWACTNNGLSKIDLDTGRITNYYESDNLVSREFNEGAVFKDRSGIIYAGGVEGFNFFASTEILDNTHRPEIAVTDFQIFNKSHKPGIESKIMKNPVIYEKEINLTYKESVFSFEFASLIFNDPSKNNYAYKLEGFDKHWNHCGSRRFATYTSIEPGSYVFKVKGTNNDGIWSDRAAEIRINISPPFWDTWWFKSASALTSLLAASLAYKSKMKRMEKEKLLHDDFSRRLIGSQETERKKIASELHDTIAHDVLIVKNKAYLGMTKEAGPEKLKEVLEDISNLSSETLTDIRSISYNLHPHKIERLGLTKAIKSILNLAEESSNINFEFQSDIDDSIFSDELRINIYRIIQELTNNIIKHSKASSALFSFVQGDSNAVLTIEDNGIGFKHTGAPVEQNAGMGLAGISERIRLYGGSFDIQSTPEKGTAIKIVIPIKEEKNETAE